jgi:hypothetical protein
MKYPDYVIEKLKKEHKQLDDVFSRVWGLMSPSKERDEIMWHVITAKKKISELIEKEEE